MSRRRGGQTPRSFSFSKRLFVPIGIVVIVDATGDIVVFEQLSLRRAIRDDGGEEGGEVALARIGRRNNGFGGCEDDAS